MHLKKNLLKQIMLDRYLPMNLLITYMEKLQHQESQWHWLPVSQEMENDFSSLIKDSKEIARCTIDWANKDVKNYLDNIPYNIEINLNDLI